MAVSAAVAWARAEWRRQWRSLVVVPVVPVAVVLLVGLVGIVVANLIGVPRAWAARRLSPSAVLRTE